jgi:transposase
MKKILTELLGLEGIIVESIKEIEETIIFSVKMWRKTARCPICGQESRRLHQNHRHLVKDLPMGNKSVILNLNRRRFKCETCQKPFTEILDFVESKKSFTKRLAEKITEQIIHSDLKNVAKNNGLTEEEVESMLKSVAKKILPIDVSNLSKLGIDEISLTKGQGNFIVVLVDLLKHKLVGLVAKRTQSEIKKVLNNWGEKVLNQIEEVSMDMTGNYKSLIEKICPNASITVDRFHVMKIINQELNQSRIDQKKTAETLHKEERAKLFNGLKGSKYLLLKNEKDLSSQQSQKLEILKEASPLVGIMHSLKEELHDLFERCNNCGEGTLALLDWLKKASPYYHKSVKTIKRWFGEIIGYFESRTTQGVVEGINNKLKLLKRCGFGFRNFDNFTLRSLLFWHFTKNLAH